MADLITRLKADVSNHNKGFSSAQKAISNYANSATSLDGVVKGAIGTLSKYVTASAAVTTALKVGKDAFFASEKNIDEWGRTVEVASSLYESFLNSINNGDISGFLGNIDRIVSAAREAYNALDELSTQKAIDNPRLKAQQTENERMRAMLRTGRYISPGDGRKSSMKEGDILSDSQKQKIAERLQNGIKSINSIIKDEIHTTTNAIDKLYDEQAVQLGVTRKEFDAATKDMTSFRKALEMGAKYTEWENKQKYEASKAAAGLAFDEKYNGANPYQKYAWVNTFKDDGDLFSKINELINQRAGLQSQSFSTTSQAYRAINGATGGGKSGGKGGKSSKTTKVAEPVIDPTAYLPEDISEITNALRVYADQWGESIASTLKESISEGLTTLPESVNKGLESVNDAFAESLANARNDVMVKQAQETQAAWQNAASAMSSVGSALQSIEDPSAKVAGILAQAVASVMAGFATALAAPANSAGGVWSWIAAAAAGMATAVATVAEIKSVGQYADGGVIGGNSYVGDKLFARVNSGETILNASQSQRALDMMDAPGGRFGGGNSTISGEQIVTVINNYGRRTGRGEILR